MLMSIPDIGTTAIGTGHGWLLPILILCLAVIVVLAVVVVRQHRLIKRKNRYIVRYVGQYLSLKYKEFPELCKWHEDSELTQMELIKIMHLLKKMLCGCTLLLSTLPAVAQESTNAACVSCFVPADNRFYVPFGRNDAELAQLEKCVEKHYEDISAGLMPLRVDGYCNSESSRREDLETAAAPGKDYTLSLRANLLRWATLTPDLGLEWRVSRSWGILVHGSWTSWSWNDKDRRYALWEVSPEVRYYIGKEKRGYIGAMYKAGSFNYKLSTVGKQGDLMGGGITGGYLLKLNNALSLDFNLAVGGLHADYDKYTVLDGVRVCYDKESKNRWGPVNAGVTLVWKIF